MDSICVVPTWSKPGVLSRAVDWAEPRGSEAVMELNFTRVGCMK